MLTPAIVPLCLSIPILFTTNKHLFDAPLHIWLIVRLSIFFRKNFFPSIQYGYLIFHPNCVIFAQGIVYFLLLFLLLLLFICFFFVFATSIALFRLRFFFASSSFVYFIHVFNPIRLSLLCQPLNYVCSVAFKQKKNNPKQKICHQCVISPRFFSSFCFAFLWIYFLRLLLDFQLCPR